MRVKPAGDLFTTCASKSLARIQTLYPRVVTIFAEGAPQVAAPNRGAIFFFVAESLSTTRNVLFVFSPPL